MQFNVSFDAANSPDLGSLTAPERQAILTTMNAAAQIWSHYLTPGNVTLDIKIAVDNSLFSGNVLADGGPDAYAATGAAFNGKPVYDTAAAIKLRGGPDINGAAPEIDIGLTVNSIRNFLSFSTDDSAPVPAGRYDALSVFLHEIGHGLGIIDASESASFPGVGVYDTLVQNGKFIGANAEAAAGLPTGIPLEPGSLSHIAESSLFGGDVMSTALTSGTAAHLSALDLAILKDIGIAVRAATAGDDDVTALYGADLHLGAGNDTGHAVAGGSVIYGEDGNDTLYGDKGADTLYGGDGNDILFGGAGNDTLNGGAGSDIATYSGLASNYLVMRLSANMFQVRDLRTGTPDGIDILTDVENIKWGDGTTTNLIASPAGPPAPAPASTNRAPVVTTAGITAQKNQVLALSSLFKASDLDGDIITKYQLRDTTADPASGHFAVNGVAQAAGTVIEITAAQLAQTSFVTGTVGDNLQIRAFDGTAWSAADNAVWAPFTVSVPANRAPVVTTGTVSAKKNQVLSLSSLFKASDPDGDAITKYQLKDASADPASGHIVVNGVAQPANSVIEITAAQLAQTSFVTGTVGDNLQIRAFDGTAWSAADNATWAPFSVAVTANRAPAVMTSGITAKKNQTLALSSLFTVSDPDGDSMTKYQLKDTTTDPASGHFVVGGVAQAAGAVIEVSAGQLAQTSFVTGTAGDNLQIRAFDGTSWSAADNAPWAPFTVSVVNTNSPPVVTAHDITVHAGKTLAASSLFTASDPDGDTITEYQLWDTSFAASSGHFVVGGVAPATGTVIDISAAKLAQTSFITGTTGDTLMVRAFDGKSWGAGDGAVWATIHLAVG